MEQHSRARDLVDANRKCNNVKFRIKRNDDWHVFKTLREILSRNRNISGMPAEARVFEAGVGVSRESY